MNEPWLASLQTDTPQAGFDLAVKLSRVSIKTIQPTDDIRKELRAAYDGDTAQLIASAHVIALNFQTVSAANNYWR
jgi:Hexameric tyrosine-coordinated heme protein (HTHP)